MNKEPIKRETTIPCGAGAHCTDASFAVKDIAISHQVFAPNKCGEWWDRNKMSDMWTGAWKGMEWRDLDKVTQAEIEQLYDDAR